MMTSLRSRLLRLALAAVERRVFGPRSPGWSAGYGGDIRRARPGARWPVGAGIAGRRKPTSRRAWWQRPLKRLT